MPCRGRGKFAELTCATAGVTGSGSRTCHFGMPPRRAGRDRNGTRRDGAVADPERLTPRAAVAGCVGPFEASSAVRTARYGAAAAVSSSCSAYARTACDAANIPSPGSMAMSGLSAGPGLASRRSVRRPNGLYSCPVSRFLGGVSSRVQGRNGRDRADEPVRSVPFAGRQAATAGPARTGLAESVSPLCADTPPGTPRRPESACGAFSISLAVPDLGTSREFYEKPGFHETGRDGESYLIVIDGLTVLGLFQQMFEKNTLTFGPGLGQDTERLRDFTDIRDIRRRLVDAGIEIIANLDPRGHPTRVGHLSRPGRQSHSRRPVLPKAGKPRGLMTTCLIRFRAIAPPATP